MPALAHLLKPSKVANAKVFLSGLPDGHTEKYCKINSDNRKKASYFEMELLLNGKYYAYGFEVILSQSKFISEWLVELHADNTEKTLFTMRQYVQKIPAIPYCRCGQFLSPSLKKTVTLKKRKQTLMMIKRNGAKLEMLFHIHCHI